jgi:hypothetical protein
LAVRAQSVLIVDVPDQDALPRAQLDGYRFGVHLFRPEPSCEAVWRYAACLAEAAEICPSAKCYLGIRGQEMREITE